MITLSEALKYETLTSVQLLSLISSSSLVPSLNYLVTDALNTDGGVLVQAVTTNSVTSIGSGIFLNADYQGVGNYSSMTPTFNSFKGIWNNTIKPVVAGDVVVFNNNNYVNITGNWGSQPSGDAVNWTLLPRTNGYGYITEIDEVTYNVNSNTFNTRRDKRGNYLENNNSIYFQIFQWGRDLVYNNTMLSNSYMNMPNTSCQVYNNFLSEGSFFEDITDVDTNGTIYKNNLTCESYIFTENNQGDIYENDLKSNSYIQINVLLHPTISVNYNTLSSNSLITSTASVNTSISSNNITIGAIFVSGAIAGGQVASNIINGCQLNLSNLVNTSITQNTINDSCNITNGFNGSYQLNTNNSPIVINSISQTLTSCTFSVDITITLNITSFTAFKVCRFGYSNFEETLDFTTSYNAGTKTLTIPASSNYVGIFKLSNTSSNIVQSIVNCPSRFPVVFQPNNTQVVSFEHTAIGTAVANDLVSDAGNFTNTLTGRTNGSDFVEYKKSGNLLVRNNIVVLI